MPKRLILALLAHVSWGCDETQRAPTPLLAMNVPRELASAASEASNGPRSDRGPIRIEMLEDDGSPPAFVMRGGPRGSDRLVFLHGICGHGWGYAQSFQFGASRKGTLIAPQGDVSCGGVWSKWSANIDALDERISKIFRTLGEPEPLGEIVVIGMSQGASRAEELARRHPNRYTRLISMASPAALKPGSLPNLRGAVFMAGERDRRDLMQASARALQNSGVPSTFMIIPEATHGAMGPTPEKTMGEALDWLWANSKPSSTASTAKADVPTSR